MGAVTTPARPTVFPRNTSWVSIFANRSRTGTGSRHPRLRIDVDIDILIRTDFDIDSDSGGTNYGIIDIGGY